MNPRIVALLLVLAAPPVFAADPAEMLKDPALETRAEKIGQGLRCLVCQSESIENSNADLARDLRVIVREQVQAGQSDDQIRAFVVARYGDYVLLAPPFKTSTLLLWGGPGLFLLGGLAALRSFHRRRVGTPPPPPLSADEQRRLDQLLNNEDA